MDVSVLHVQRLRAAYLSTGAAPVLRDSGGPGRKASPDEVEAVLRAYRRHCCGAVYLERILAGTGATHMPHNVIRRILRDDGLASGDPAERGRRSWVRHGRTHSNPVWRTDYKLLDGGRRLVAYRDDASRFITGHGVSANATGRHAIDVLRAAIRRHGRPASILTDRCSQFYANESESRQRGVSEFEELARLGIRHILARVDHPQTNGNLGRFHGELQRRLGRFGTADRPVHRWNETKPRRSLDWESLEAPARAFVRKMPPEGTVVKDEQTGESYNVM